MPVEIIALILYIIFRIKYENGMYFYRAQWTQAIIKLLGIFDILMWIFVSVNT